MFDFGCTQADVLVNSTDPHLKHEGGTVSKLLMEKAGPQLIAQCQELYPKGMDENIVAVTDSFKMDNFKKIFHIALYQDFWPDQVTSHRV